MATPQHSLKVYAELSTGTRDPRLRDLARSLEVQVVERMRSDGTLARLNEFATSKRLQTQIAELGRQMESKWPPPPELDASVRKVAEQLGQLAPTMRVAEHVLATVDMSALHEALAEASVRLDPETVERIAAIGDQLEAAEEDLPDEDLTGLEPTEDERRAIASWMESVNLARRQLLYNPNPWLLFVFDQLINLSMQILFSSFSPDSVVEIHKTVIDIDVNVDAGDGPGH